MSAMRSGPKGADLASFGLAGLFFFLASTPVAYQDLSAAITIQEPARAREYAIASPFGTIHAATLSLPQPVGTAIPEAPKIRLASLDPSEDIVGSITIGPPAARGGLLPPPTINRTNKGDRLIVPRAVDQAQTQQQEQQQAQQQQQRQQQQAQQQQEAAQQQAQQQQQQQPQPQPSEEFPALQGDVLAAIEQDALRLGATPPAKADEIEAAMRVVPFPEYDIAMSLEMRPRIAVEQPLEVAKLDPADLYPTAPPSLDGLNAEVKTERILFGNNLFGSGLGSIEPWAVGEEPILLMPRAPADPKPFDANPAEPVAVQPPTPAVAAQPATPAAVPSPDAGITVAAKGDGAADAQHQQSPAERLNLTGDKRAKAVKCLANAIYFESGLEPVRGQIAVAQVVVNRAFSGYYPKDICGVVFQNAHRYMTCQFTFACNGKPLIASSQPMWQRAVRIAEETLDGKLWLPEVGKATHYHADYVNPWWNRTMNKYTKIGAHIFFRPRMWGDGADKPSWGSASYTTEAAQKL